MVYTVKKKKRKADEMRVFLHDSCVLFTKVTTIKEESSLSNHRAFEHLYSIKVRLQDFWCLQSLFCNIFKIPVGELPKAVRDC